MDISTEDYEVIYNSEKAVVFFCGCLRLDGIEEYQPIMTLLTAALEQSPKLCVDFSKLEFLNSSGISMLSMFVMKARQKGNTQLTLIGSDSVLWQTKSLKNLQRLLPAMELTFTS